MIIFGMFVVSLLVCVGFAFDIVTMLTVYKDSLKDYPNRVYQLRNKKLNLCISILIAIIFGLLFTMSQN